MVSGCVTSNSFLAATPGIDFLREKGSTASNTLKVIEVVMIHPYWDMALLRVDGLGDKQPVAAVPAASGGCGGAGHCLCHRGTPHLIRATMRRFRTRVFGGVYYIKRLQPGRDRQLGGLVESFGTNVLAVTLVTARRSARQFGIGCRARVDRRGDRAAFRGDIPGCEFRRSHM